METEVSAQPLLERRSALWCVAVLIAVLFSVTNLPWTLDDYDQAKQAFTSYEMVTQGHWIFQHTPKGRIATKPPLIGWISAGAFAVTRSWDFAWRLPSLAAALWLAIALTRAARDVSRATAGLIALSAFGLNLLSPRLASLVRTDMPLAIVTALIGLKIWHKVRNAEPWQPRDRLVMFVMLTAAMLIKGPIIYAFLLPGLIAFQWWTRGAEQRASAWSGWWPWIASFAVFAAWVAAGIAWVPGFYNEVVLREFAGRFGETVHQARSMFFYLPHLLHKFAPWSVLGIAFGVLAWRASKRTTGESLKLLSPEMVWLLCWSFGGLLVMSLVPSKRVDRIFPIVPPLSLALAAAVASLSTSDALRGRVQRWSMATLVVACLGISAFAAQRVIRSYRSDDAALVNFGAEVRRAAADHGWRYELIGWREEGLLLYLRRDRFLKREEAIARWNAGALDAVVVRVEEVPSLLAVMAGATTSTTEAAITINGEVRRYVLLTRG